MFDRMTLEKFIQLDHSQKEETLLTKAEFLGNYHGLSIFIHLYRLGDFYVESCYKTGCDETYNISASESLLNLPCFVKIKEQGFGLL